MTKGWERTGTVREMPGFSAAPDKRIIKEPSAAARSAFFYLLGCGQRTAYGADFPARQNPQSFLFIAVAEGAARLNDNGIVSRLAQGDCLFLDGRSPHIVQSAGDAPCRLIWVQFGGATSAEYYKLFLRQQTPAFHPVSAVHFISLAEEIMRVNAADYEDAEVRTSELLMRLLTMLLTVSSIPEESDSALQAKLKTVLKHINTHYTQDISLDELARRFDISKYYLTREFRRAYGETIFQHIITLRIDAAKQLLRDTDKTVEEIAALCGFNDQSYFSKQFKKAEGVTCLAFRRRWRGTES